MKSLSERRIELWVEPREGRPAVNPVMRQLLDELAAAGAGFSVRVPEHEIVDPMRHVAEPPPDLVLLKSATSLALSLAMADEAHGGRFLNSARATWCAHDKAAVVARLAAAGLPVPTTFLTAATVDGIPPPPGVDGAWVTKPVYGVHGHGVAIHAAFPTAIAPTPVPPDAYVVDDGTRLVQRRIGGDDVDLKVYVAGDRCFAGAKRFDATSYATDRVEPIDLDPATADLVRAAGACLGLRCFGVDLRFDRSDPVIVDVNPFPGYRGFPAAVAVLRAEIDRCLADAAS